MIMLEVFDLIGFRGHLQKEKGDTSERTFISIVLQSNPCSFIALWMQVGSIAVIWSFVKTVNKWPASITLPGRWLALQRAKAQVNWDIHNCCTILYIG